MTTTATTGTGLSPLLTDAETARQMLGGISRGTLANLIDRGHLRGVKVGRRLMFRTTDLEAYVASLPEAGDRPDA